MSQEKVNYKKDQKKNRKAINRKKKFEYRLAVVIASILALVVVGWIGYSVYTKVDAYLTANQEYNYYEVNTDAIQDYLSDVAGE